MFPACTPLRGRRNAAPSSTGNRPAIAHATHSIVATSMHCRRCGYDLKGLDVSGRCPECGLAVAETITQIVDPAASTLPRLRDPLGTGTGLLGLAATHLVAAWLVVLPHAAPALDTLLGSKGAGLGWLPVAPRAAAAIVASTAFAWLYLLARAPAEEPSASARRNLRWMVFGQVWWTATVGIPPLVERLGHAQRPLIAPLEALSVPGAVVAFIGLRGLLMIIGLRSRAYRTARGGRQSIDALVAAIVAGAAGNLINAAGIAANNELVATIGATIYGVSVLLLLLGLVYLLVNCWWIRSALRSPPPKLEDLLTSGDGGRA